MNYWNDVPITKNTQEKIYDRTKLQMHDNTDQKECYILNSLMLRDKDLF